MAERLIDAVCRFDCPKDRLEVQVLDDSTDEIVERVQALVHKLDGKKRPYDLESSLK